MVPLRLRTAVLVALAWALTALAPAAAAPGTGSVPEDVATWFEHSAAQTLSDLEGGAGWEVGQVHPVHTWDRDFVAGAEDAPVLAPAQEWLATVSGPGGPGRLLVAWRDPRLGEVAMARTWVEPELATALAQKPEDALLVVDPMSSQWFGLSGELVPLNQVLEGVTAPVTVGQVQQLLQARQRVIDAQDDGSGDLAGVPGLVPTTAPQVGSAAPGDSAGAAAASGPRDGSGLGRGGLTLGAAALLLAVGAATALVRRRSTVRSTVTGTQGAPGPRR